jgi:8-oxo-dGTP diphosphatase
MIEYCLGFAFDDEYESVLLIEKAKPLWQKGFFNGVGGKLELGETPEEAMQREFLEETGIHSTKWTGFGTLGGREWTIHLFAKTFTLYNLNKAVQMEEEVPYVVNLKQEFPRILKITNLTWLVPMAIDSLKTGTGFIIDEINLHR